MTSSSQWCGVKLSGEAGNGDSLGMKQMRKTLENEEEDERITKIAVTTNLLLAGAVAPADWLLPQLGSGRSLEENVGVG